MGGEDHGDSGRELELQAKLFCKIVFWVENQLQSLNYVFMFSQHRLDIKPPPNGELWGENINGSFNGLVISNTKNVQLCYLVASSPKTKVGMLQRGDSDIGWADLYIIPDRARFFLKNFTN